MTTTRPIPDRDDLASFVESRYRETEDGCWEFTGSIAGNGRPRVSVEGVSLYAYRVAYTAWVGPIPAGLQINHHCDNPICIRPEHLYAGTQADNNADAIARGRYAPLPVLVGEASPRSILTAEQVVDIATRYADRTATQQQLADEYGASRNVIGNIVRGRSYPEVERPITRRGVGVHLSRQPCGTRAGWDTHRRKGTPACDGCREANRVYMLAYKRARRDRFTGGAA